MMENEEKKKFTWADLKKAVNEIPEELLQREVFAWSEDDERGCRITNIEELTEDYLDDGDSGCAAASEMQGALEDEKRDYPGETSEYYVVHPKGTRILHAYFPF